MCFTHVKYSCNHNGKCVLKCRKLWSARTSWCCYPAFLFTFGWPNEEPCGDFVERKAFFSPKICPECTEAEQSAPQTRGIVPRKYRHKLTPEALNASRQRMKEEREKEDAVKERWYTREENFQKREQKGRLNQDVTGSTAETDKALPDMPSFIHVPLGDRWGDPSYHYPPHIADAYDAAPLTPPRDRGRLGSYVQQEQPPQQPDRMVKNIDVVLKDRDQQSEQRHHDRHCADRHRHGGEHFASPVDGFRHAQYLTALSDNVDQNRYAAHHVTIPNPDPYHHFEEEPVYGGRVGQTLKTQQQRPQQSLHGQGGYTEPRSLTNTRLAPKLPIQERQGHRRPQILAHERSRPGEPRRRDTEPTPPVRTPRSGLLKGFFHAFGSNSHRSEDARCDRYESRKVAVDAHSDVSSFVCHDSRDVERGRIM
ncbi:uncharacterized protein LY79DRAFT_664826 [Colletotrichum navitas]|uniref:Uncharacterized protein n=1 Tax=Colletotrichum navitas TaxID=681940 RepID=A0AAD8QDH5_9PEZI|nr:uncharacterized protein LY79DRAFT_664826 [Colletotrichum navitas]KAK1600570.1 hypothetical protein LY79DRAFT_664826 [Colletotrichum navitas]